MTDSQIKYQTLMENQRHNLEMERLGGEEAATKARDVEIKSKALAWKKKHEFLNDVLGAGSYLFKGNELALKSYDQAFDTGIGIAKFFK